MTAQQVIGSLATVIAAYPSAAFGRPKPVAATVEILAGSP